MNNVYHFISYLNRYTSFRNSKRYCQRIHSDKEELQLYEVHGTIRALCSVLPRIFAGVVAKFSASTGAPPHWAQNRDMRSAHSVISMVAIIQPNCFSQAQFFEECTYLRRPHYFVHT